METNKITGIVTMDLTKYNKLYEVLSELKALNLSEDSLVYNYTLTSILAEYKYFVSLMVDDLDNYEYFSFALSNKQLYLELSLDGESPELIFLIESK